MLLILSGFTFIQSNKYVSIKMKSNILMKGTVVNTDADLYYNYTTGKLVTYFNKPLKYTMISNSKGEAKIYFPEKNEVIVNRDDAFNSDYSLIYFFLANKTSDLGLKDMGFTLSNTSFKDGHMITNWVASTSGTSGVEKVELVHKNFQPIYIEYITKDDKTLQKVFYYDYKPVGSIKFPMKVVEFNYLSDGDSAITKTTYSDIVFGINDLNKSKYDFEVPTNAKVIEN